MNSEQQQSERATQNALAWEEYLQDGEQLLRQRIIQRDPPRVVKGELEAQWAEYTENGGEPIAPFAGEGESLLARSRETEKHISVTYRQM